MAGDTGNALAADLASCIAREGLGKRWTALAEKDLGLSTVAEAKFQEALRIARKRLAGQTLLLCGLSPEEYECEEPETAVPRIAWGDLCAAPRRLRKARVVPGQMSLFDLLEIAEVIAS
jgi:hypothetical protein